jgi:hypothetical protein
MSALTHPHPSPQARDRSAHRETTSVLLTCGILAGPLFVGSSLLQALLRPGFDLTRHGISMLLLGGFGWTHVVTVELAGLYVIAGAVGARRRLHAGRARTWGPRLLAGCGLGLLIAGFAPGPAFGFFVSISSFIAATFVFTSRFLARRDRAWAAYSAACGVGAPLLVVLSSVLAPTCGVPLFGVALVTAGWMSGVSARLLVRSA